MRLRHSLQLLQDAQLVQFPITGWPLLWGDIAYHTVGLNKDNMTGPERSALNYIRFELAYQTSPNVRLQTANTLSNETPLYQSFTSTHRERAASSVKVDWMGNYFAYQLDVTKAFEAQDHKNWRLDNTYLAMVAGNWAFSVGAVDRWWGAGWDTSLTLSNNARAIPAFSLQRKISKPFTLPILKWMGPWQLTSFLGKLEQNRVIAGANVGGARFSFVPIPQLELGLTRVVQWGGSAKNSSLSGLISAFTSGSNAQQTGVQLNSLDFRLGGKKNQYTYALYGQWVMAGAVQHTNKNLYMVGAEMTGLEYFSLKNNRLWLEWSSTSSGHIDGTNSGGAIYSDDIYQSGYHYFGRSMGSGYDAGSRSVAMGLQTYLDAGDDVEFTLRYLQLNQAGYSSIQTSLAPPVNVMGMQIKLSKLVDKNKIQAGINLHNKTLNTGLASLDRFGLFVKTEYRF
jgi:hypothetical protein